jgi:molecular chaperone GrpE
VSKKFQNKAAEDVAAEEKEEASEVDNSGENNADVEKDSAGQADDASDADEPKDGEKPSDQKDAVIADLQDRIKRQMAEFDNFRKRTDKEKSAMFEMGASDVIKKLLPVVDNFERGFKSLTDDEKETPFAKGMDMVYKQTLKMLNELGVAPIEAVGQEFNPELHNAVMHVEDESAGENIIIEEFEKGYTYKETVIRHSMVKVAN